MDNCGQIHLLLFVIHNLFKKVILKWIIVDKSECGQLRAAAHILLLPSTTMSLSSSFIYFDRIISCFCREVNFVEKSEKVPEQI